MTISYAKYINHYLNFLTNYINNLAAYINGYYKKIHDYCKKHNIDESKLKRSQKVIDYEKDIDNSYNKATKLYKNLKYIRDQYKIGANVQWLLRDFNTSIMMTKLPIYEGVTLEFTTKQATPNLNFEKPDNNSTPMKNNQPQPKLEPKKDVKETKPEVNNNKPTDTDKIRRISNGSKIGDYVMYNPVAHGGKYYIDLSKNAEAYLRDVGGNGIVTSGAEGSHAKGTISHGSGNKIDVAAKVNSDESWADTAIPFIRNKNTAYINFESFTVSEFNCIRQLITTKAPDTASRFNEKSSYSFDGQKRFIFPWMNKGHGKHLDIGIKPDSYSEK